MADHLKLGARYYDPTLARFTQTDPAGQGPNLYSYAGDDPTNFTDPTGTISFVMGVIIGVGAVALSATLLLATPGLLVAGTMAFTAVTTVAVLGGIFATTGGAACAFNSGCP